MPKNDTDEDDNDEDIIDRLTSLIDIDSETAQACIDNMDADEVINLVAALDDKDTDKVKELVKEYTPEEMEKSKIDPPEALDDINKQGIRCIEKHEKLTDVWDIIAELAIEDWHIIWPMLDKRVIRALYKEATKQDLVTLSNKAKNIIYKHSQKLTEYVLYEDQLYEVAIPNGPKETIGIKQNGKITMVGKNKVKRVDEHVLGMTKMPAISRMMELAGISADSHENTAPEVALPVIQTAEPKVHAHKGKVQTRLDELLADVEKLRCAITDDHDLEVAEHACHSLASSLHILHKALKTAQDKK
jgi:hypothetical protein